MRQIQIEDNVFLAAERRAAAVGYSSVDQYVADVLVQDLTEAGAAETPNLDHLFTPERLAKIDAAAAEIVAGRFYTTEQADAELARRRMEWLRNNPTWKNKLADELTP